MRRRPRGGSAALGLGLLCMTIATLPARAQDAVPESWRLAYDFMVQDVCTDASGKAMVGVSPLDGAAKCPVHRNLEPGERLPYHKQDWAPLEKRAANPYGVQRSDSFPIETGGYGRAIVQNWDFGAGDRVFGRFDHGDGGQIALFSPRTLGYAFTEDGKGQHFFYGAGCNLTPQQGVLDSWVLVDRDFALDRPGGLVSRITMDRAACQNGHLGYAATRWRTERMNFRTKTEDGIASRVMVTLISDHFGGRDPETAGSLERFYFTRELGWTRWERWQNLARHERPDDRARAKALTASDQCDPGQAIPATSGEWVMVACRQWTNIMPPSSPAGDPPTFWIEDFLRDPQMRALFGP